MHVAPPNRLLLADGWGVTGARGTGETKHGSSAHTAITELVENRQRFPLHFFMVC